MTEQTMVEIEIGSAAAITKSEDFSHSLALVCGQFCEIPGFKPGDPIEPQFLFDHNFAIVLALGNQFVNAISLTAASMGMDPGEVAGPALLGLGYMVDAMTSGVQPERFEQREGGALQ